jgi:hypothetical protein
MRWKRKKRNLEQARASYSAVHPETDLNLTELYERAPLPRHRADDPRNFSDFGDVPGDVELAAEIDAGTEPEWEHDRHFARVVQEGQEGQEQRTPRETWRKWRAYGRRHVTEDPEQTQDRIHRHQAAEAARMARIDRATAGRIQDRFDGRTASSVASNANRSRALNMRHAEQPPVMSPRFDFQAESVNGGPYRSGRASGQRSGHADYSWNMSDGF